jgi:hypothetical protein
LGAACFFPLEHKKGLNCIALAQGESGLTCTLFPGLGLGLGRKGVLDGLARTAVYTNEKKNEVTIKKNTRGSSGVQALIGLISMNMCLGAGDDTKI